MDWTLIENMTAFDFNMPTSRYADSQPIPLPGPSLQPLLSASADFASILIGESVNLSWSSTGAATLTCEPGPGTLDAAGSLAVSPAADTTYTFTATAAGGRTTTATVFIHVADPTVDTIAYDDFDIAGDELNLFSTTQGADLTDTARTGSPFVVHATCTPGDLDISINGIPVVSNLNVDLAAIGALDASNRAYVGFTARTGGSFECHDVTSWHFTPLEAGYTAWVGGFDGLSDPAPGADPDGDGLTNLLEYVLDGHPAESSTGILPKGPVDAAGNLRFTYVRRAESKADTTQVLQLSTDLVTWTGSEVPGATAGNVEVVGNWPAAGLETVTITVPPSAAADGRLFARLRVEQP